MRASLGEAALFCFQHFSALVLQQTFTFTIWKRRLVFQWIFYFAGTLECSTLRYLPSEKDRFLGGFVDVGCPPVSMTGFLAGKFSIYRFIFPMKTSVCR
jgi:hypothetical protein